MSDEQRRSYPPMIEARYGDYEVLRLSRRRWLVQRRPGLADCTKLRPFEDRDEARLFAQDEFIADGGELVEGKEWRRPRRRRRNWS